MTRYLSRPEELRLIEAFQDGDRHAGEKLITSHEGMIKRLALKYSRAGISSDDLISEGRVGFLVAIYKFDPSRGARLNTMARWWVRQFVGQYIFKAFSVVALRENMENKRDFYHGNNKRLPDCSLDREKYPGVTYLDGTPDPTDVMEGIEERDELRYRKGLLRGAMETLQGRNRTIFIKRKIADPPETLESLGRKFGICRERVRQIEAAGFKKVRDAVLEAA